MSRAAAIALAVIAAALVPTATLSAARFALPIPLGLTEPDIPADDPLTTEKIALGKRLFNDPRLSADRQTSCARCHSPAHDFAGIAPLDRDAMRRPLRRHTPSIINSGYLTSIGWDGRFRSLEEQALEPFHDWGDMGIDVDTALDRIDSDSSYPQAFQDAFGRKADTTTLARAIAAFERSLLSGDTRFDRFLFGDDPGALTRDERAGYDVFTGRGRCINCHDIFHPSLNPLGGGIALFSDHRFHNLGVGLRNAIMTDPGRYEITRDPEDWGAFKTPSLRNIALRPPYMHDGSLKSLTDVVEFYDRGGNKNGNIADGITRLYLTPEEKHELVAFLGSLTDRRLELKQRPGR